jgi:hypothetical protein
LYYRPATPRIYGIIPRHSFPIGGGACPETHTPRLTRVARVSGHPPPLSAKVCVILAGSPGARRNWYGRWEVMSWVGLCELSHCIPGFYPLTVRQK